VLPPVLRPRVPRSRYAFVQPRVRERGAITGQRACTPARRSIGSGYDTIQRADGWNHSPVGELRSRGQRATTCTPSVRDRGLRDRIAPARSALPIESVAPMRRFHGSSRIGSVWRSCRVCDLVRDDRSRSSVLIPLLNAEKFSTSPITIVIPRA